MKNTIILDSGYPRLAFRTHDYVKLNNFDWLMTKALHYRHHSYLLQYDADIAKDKMEIKLGTQWRAEDNDKVEIIRQNLDN